MAVPPLQALKLGSGNYARENDLVRNFARARAQNAYDQMRFGEQYLDPTYGAIARVIANARSESADRGFGQSGRIAQLTADQPLHSVRLQARDAALNLSQGGLDNAYEYNRGRSDSATNSMAWGVDNNYYGRPDQGVYRIARARARGQVGR